jgi:hypothetical protein
MILSQIENGVEHCFQAAPSVFGEFQGKGLSHYKRKTSFDLSAFGRRHGSAKPGFRRFLLAAYGGMRNGEQIRDLFSVQPTEILEFDDPSLPGTESRQPVDGLIQSQETDPSRRTRQLPNR